jgi:hypothetical protein
MALQTPLPPPLDQHPPVLPELLSPYFCSESSHTFPPPDSSLKTQVGSVSSSFKHLSGSHSN